MIIEGPSITGRAFLFIQTMLFKIIALKNSVDYVQIAGKARVEVWLGVDRFHRPVGAVCSTGLA